METQEEILTPEKVAEGSKDSPGCLVSYFSFFFYLMLWQICLWALIVITLPIGYLSKKYSFALGTTIYGVLFFLSFPASIILTPLIGRKISLWFREKMKSKKFSQGFAILIFVLVVGSVIGGMLMSYYEK